MLLGRASALGESSSQIFNFVNGYIRTIPRKLAILFSYQVIIKKTRKISAEVLNIPFNYF